MKKTWCVVAVLATMAMALDAQVVDRIVAVVADRPITLSDVRAARDLGLVDGAGQDESLGATIRALVDRRLMLDEADRYGSGEPDPALVDERVRAVREGAGAELPRIFARSGFDHQRLRAAVRDTLRLEHYLAQRFGIVAQPAADDVLAYYRAHPEEFTRDGRAIPFAEAEPIARQRVSARRRQQLVDDWMASLRRRGDVQVLGDF
jgi:hypothetical protein